MFDELRNLDQGNTIILPCYESPLDKVIMGCIGGCQITAIEHNAITALPGFSSYKNLLNKRLDFVEFALEYLESGAQICDQDYLDINRYNPLIAPLGVRGDYDGDKVHFFDFHGFNQINEHASEIRGIEKDDFKIFLGEFAENYAFEFSKISGSKFYSKDGWVSKAPIRVKDKVDGIIENGGGFIKCAPNEVSSIRNEISLKYSNRFSVIVVEGGVEVRKKIINASKQIADAVEQAKETGKPVEFKTNNINYVRQRAYTIGGVTVKRLSSDSVLIKSKTDTFVDRIYMDAFATIDNNEEKLLDYLQADQFLQAKQIIRMFNEKRGTYLGYQIVGGYFWMTPTNKKSRKSHFMECFASSLHAGQSIVTDIPAKYFSDFNDYSITIHDGMIKIFVPDQNQTTEIIHEENQDLI
jgi:hypothetical protein